MTPHSVRLRHRAPEGAKNSFHPEGQEMDNSNIMGFIWHGFRMSPGAGKAHRRHAIALRLASNDWRCQSKI
ncbi:hypothetical protein [Lyngbya sp. CCY1209]|uniref:hypothetical protein n=1 Tax=Lyngbya sp. CCY1209 TaxID=2886103 RepID=UPI002D209155|nr:hypothetical protein [Lyngbya sp. CCY1209]MEB3883468.1 hypothetical protein [Lyngbya sp. CCY1209]